MSKRFPMTPNERRPSDIWDDIWDDIWEDDLIYKRRDNLFCRDGRDRQAECSDSDSCSEKDYYSRAASYSLKPNQSLPAYLRSSGAHQPRLYNHSEPNFRSSGGANRRGPLNGDSRRRLECRSKSEPQSQSRSRSMPRSNSRSEPMVRRNS